MFGKKLKVYDITPEELVSYQYAKITTNKGIMWIKLYGDETPNTVANFAHLAKDGFYNGLKFHRVIAGFMAQGGCPHSASNSAMAGTGGPNWAIACETQTAKHKHARGALSMAHAGKDTGGSQFFITFVPTPHLDGVHTVFGGIEEEDIDSLMVLDSIAKNDTIETIEILDSRD